MAPFSEPDRTRKKSMMAIRPFASILLLCAACGVTTAASASVDSSPKPGGVYRLKPGTYIAASASCKAPSNAAIREYDGRGIATSDNHACKVRVLTRKGSRYTVDQFCIDTGARPGRRRTERQHVLVGDALTFTQTISGRSVRYRYCPVYQLPPGLPK
jgi:hypothetical protein